MKTTDVFPSKYLNAEDHTFDNGEITATIKDVVLERMNGKNGEQSKPVMFFRELPKGLVMNKTNWNICAKLFGSDDSDDWAGQKVIMNSIETIAYGETVKGIRIADRKPAADKTAMLKRYSELYEEGKALGVEGIENFAVPANITDTELIALGKDLRVKVDAVKTF